jgi:hypothetical protein
VTFAARNITYRRLCTRPEPCTIRRVDRKSVEEILRETEHLAAALRYLLDAAAAVDLAEAPEPEVFSGMADMLSRIFENLQRTRESLDASALNRMVRS